jgi:N-methylhydantoinase A/oxoprolinase/acetone carboxylase beta subunit
VRGCLSERRINALIIVVKGDGSLISERTAMQRPVETVLSGPAASMVGATVLSGEPDGLIVDIGGTTTDIALTHEKTPSLNDEGAMVGGWLIRVRAADVTTIGLGGDSFIQVGKDRSLRVGPQKVFSFAWICSRHDHLLDELREIREQGFDPVRAQPTCIFVHVADPFGISLTSTEQHILEIIREKPRSLRSVARMLDKDPNIIGWERLVTMGAVHRANLTPTDILHVTGGFQAWNREAAVVGVDIVAGRLGVDRDLFISRFFREYSYRLFSLVVHKLCPGMTRNESVDCADGCLLPMLFDGRDQGEGAVRFTAEVRVPLIAVGAPAAAYVPDVAERLQARLVVPEHAEVANAMGTVNGKVVERVRILVKPGETGGFFVYTPRERKIFMRLEDALSFGERWGKEYALNQAKASGAHRIETVVRRQDRHGKLSSGQDDRNKLFIESVLRISAVGDPWV